MSVHFWGGVVVGFLMAWGVAAVLLGRQIEIAIKELFGLWKR